MGYSLPTRRSPLDRRCLSNLERDGARASSPASPRCLALKQARRPSLHHGNKRAAVSPRGHGRTGREADGPPPQHTQDNTHQPTYRYYLQGPVCCAVHRACVHARPPRVGRFLPRLLLKRSSTAAFAAPVSGAMLLLRCAAAARHPAVERTPTLQRVRCLFN